MGKTWTTKPLKMWIDGKCFKIKPYDRPKKLFRQETAKGEDSGSSNQDSEHNFIIEPTPDGKLTTKFCLPPPYFKRMRHFPTLNLTLLRQETSTEIVIPEVEDTHCITITGKSEPDIINARNQIQSVVAQIREKEFVQQFIAIPVNSEEVQKNFQKFKEEILNGDPIKGMDASLFQSSLKLHLTIAVSALLNEAEEKEAIAALNDCKTQIIDPFLNEGAGPVKIRVQGIECMNDNLSKVNVLYAKAKIVHETDDNILQNLANNISNFFYDRGLVAQYRDSVNLHVTLLNTRYRNKQVKDTQQSTSFSPKRYTKWKPRIPFDARNIIEKYKDHYFGESVFNSIHLSIMSAVGEDGFYKPLSAVNF